MKKFFRNLIAFVGIVFLTFSYACNPQVLDPDGYGRVEGTDTVVFAQADDGVDFVDVNLGAVGAFATFDTKGTTNVGGAENVNSGAIVLCLRGTGLVSAKYYSQAELDAALADPANSPLTLRCPRTTCSFLVLGNMNFVKTSNGEAVNLLAAMGSSFPKSATALDSFIYRMNGAVVGTYDGVEYRTETIGEIATWGIPYVQYVESRDVNKIVIGETNLSELMQCRRLFSKVNVYVDHAGVDNLLTNTEIFLEHLNCRFQPFHHVLSGSGTAPSCKAVEVADRIDNNLTVYGTEMGSSGHVDSWTFYVPENMQGTNDAITDPNQKLPNNAPTSYCTYLVLKTRLNDSPSTGWSASDLKYRFYLGANNTNDFNLAGGSEYSVSVGFTQQALFNQGSYAWWKVDDRDGSLNHTISHTHQLYACKDSGFMQGLDVPVYVRPGRQNTVFVVGRHNSSEGNALLGRDQSFDGTLADIALSIDGSSLASYGLDCSYNASTCALTFYRVNGNFESHLNQNCPVKLTLLPSGITYTLNVQPRSDISVSLSGGNMYLGTRQTATVSGVDGTATVSGASCWNSSPNLGNSGNFLVSNGGSFSVYGTAAGTGSFTVSYGDAFNGDSKTVSFSVDAPLLQKSKDTVFLPIDGTEVDAGVGYYRTDGVTRLYQSDFVPELWSSLLSLTVSTSEANWSSCISLNDAGQLYVSKTKNGGQNLEDADFDMYGIYKLGSPGYSLTVSNDHLPGIYRKLSIYGRVTKFLFFGDFKPKEGTKWVPGSGNTQIQNQYFTQGSQIDSDDNGFTLEFNYYFRGGDFSRITFSRSGNATYYTCMNYPYEVIGPNITYTQTASDGGSGGTGLWSYWESNQTMTASNGEKVPGGLIYPYGEQTIQAVVTNKWDNRTFSAEKTFSFSQFAFLGSEYVVARPGQTNASVYFLPDKAIKYLKRMGNDVDTAHRRWMVSVGVSDSEGIVSVEDYNYSVTYDTMYHKKKPTETSINSWWLTTEQRLPAYNFNAKYIYYYLYGTETAVSWNTSLLNGFVNLDCSGVAKIMLGNCNPHDHRSVLMQTHFSDKKYYGIMWNNAESYF